MPTAKRFLNWLTLASVPPDLLVAQYGELQRQIPPLYILLSVNAVAAAFTHFDVAPLWMTTWIPAVLVAVAVTRMITWAKRPQRIADTGEARRRLRRTTALGAALAVAYMTWALALSGYGSVTQQFELRQDSFGVPVSSMDLHLEGSHTAFPEASGARLDVRQDPAGGTQEPGRPGGRPGGAAAAHRGRQLTPPEVSRAGT